MRGEKKMKELMTGIEILSVETIDDSAFLIFLGIFSMCIMALTLGFVVSALLEREYGIAIVFTLLAIVALVLATSAFVEASEAPRTYYKVTIDDSVSMNEFMKKYEIIQTDGKIYTIIEKDEMVQTSFNDGIKPGAVKMAIDILAKEDNPYGEMQR